MRIMLKNSSEADIDFRKMFFALIYTLGCNSNGLNTLKTLKVCSFLNKSQWWNIERLEQYQLYKLQRLLMYSYKNIPYYKNLFQKINLKPDDIKSLEDMEKIPTLTKEDVSQNLNKLISPVYKSCNNLFLRTTGGTTGKPLKVLLDSNTHHFFNACKIRSFTFAGVRNYHRKINFGSSTIPYPKKRNTSSGKYNPFERSLDFSATCISHRTLRTYLDQIIAFKPKFIRGFSSAVYLLALFLREKNMKMNLKAVITKSENLFEFQREIISEQFRCDVFDYYGLNEDVCSAMECCEHSGQHIDMEKGILEITRRGRKVKEGKKGRIIATNLNNYVMPLIRYETGDIGSISKKECACGRGLKLLNQLEGRVADIVVLYNGTMISPTEFSIVVKSVNNIEECQFIQTSEYEILIKVVKRKGFTKKDAENLILNTKHLTGSNIKVDLEFTDFIKRKKNRKFKLVLSKFDPIKIKNLI